MDESLLRNSNEKDPRKPITADFSRLKEGFKNIISKGIGHQS